MYKSKIDVFHIYWGTSGNSGLYIDEIYKCLEYRGYKQRAFVNYYYPFDYGDKIFFKRGDIANSKYRGPVRKLFQLVEVLFGFFYILWWSYRQKPKVVNFSHVGSSFFFTYWFLKIIRKVSSSKLVVTCHDVMPLTLSNNNRSEMKYRRKIFHIADVLLVHNLNSIRELKDKFNIDPERVVFHSFPLMDLTKMQPQTDSKFEKVDFLFIGHLRKAKGIELLLDAWMDFHRINPEAKLRICGKKPSDVHFDKNILEKNGVEFNLHFISDDDYYHYVKATRYVILPYLLGTNSGIISTVLSLGTEVITSDLLMFSENELVNPKDMFKTGDKESLILKLNEKFSIKQNSAACKILAYREKFNEQVSTIYNKLCN